TPLAAWRRRHPCCRPPPSLPPSAASAAAVAATAAIPTAVPLLLLHRPRGNWWRRRTAVRLHSQQRRRSAALLSPVSATHRLRLPLAEGHRSCRRRRLHPAPGRHRAKPSAAHEAASLPSTGRRPRSRLLTPSLSGRVATSPSPSLCRGCLRQPSPRIDSFRRPLAPASSASPPSTVAAPTAALIRPPSPCPSPPSVAPSRSR
ncbi:Os06g0648600, partial [Oryza sativa Japonica Group]